MSKNPFKKESPETEEQKQEIKDEKTEEIKEETAEKSTDNKEEYEKLNQQYIRLAADFDNYRKRQAQERESLLKFGTENALTKMLDVIDNFERGEKALENVEDCAKVKESFNLIHKQVLETLQKLGLEEIDAEGQEFDPNFHDAVMQTPTSEHPEHTVINVLQKGYKMGDKVIRHAQVVVGMNK